MTTTVRKNLEVLGVQSAQQTLVSFESNDMPIVELLGIKPEITADGMMIHGIDDVYNAALTTRENLPNISISQQQAELARKAGMSCLQIFQALPEVKAFNDRPGAYNPIDPSKLGPTARELYDRYADYAGATNPTQVGKDPEKVRLLCDIMDAFSMIGAKRDSFETGLAKHGLRPLPHRYSY